MHRCDGWGRDAHHTDGDVLAVTPAAYAEMAVLCDACYARYQAEQGAATQAPPVHLLTRWLGPDAQMCAGWLTLPSVAAAEAHMLEVIQRGLMRMDTPDGELNPMRFYVPLHRIVDWALWAERPEAPPPPNAPPCDACGIPLTGGGVVVQQRLTAGTQVKRVCVPCADRLIAGGWTRAARVGVQ
jgi:hypothetical protein